MTLTRAYTIAFYLYHNSFTFTELKPKDSLTKRDIAFLDFYGKLQTEFESLKEQYKELVSIELDSYSIFQMPVSKEVLPIEPRPDYTVCKIDGTNSAYQKFMNYTFYRLNRSHTMSFSYNESNGELEITAFSPQHHSIVQFTLIFERVLINETEEIRMRILCDSNERNEVHSIVKSLYDRYNVEITNCGTLLPAENGEYCLFIPDSHILHEEFPVLIDSLRCHYVDVVEGAIQNIYEELSGDFVVYNRAIRDNTATVLTEMYSRMDTLHGYSIMGLINQLVVQKYSHSPELVDSASQLAIDLLMSNRCCLIGKRFSAMTLLHCANVLNRSYPPELITSLITVNSNMDVQTVHFLIELIR